MDRLLGDGVSAIRGLFGHHRDGPQVSEAGEGAERGRHEQGDLGNSCLQITFWSLVLSLGKPSPALLCPPNNVVSSQ